MVDAWLKFFLEAPWSASLVPLIAAVIGGGFSFLGSWFAMRGSLKAQFRLQQNEWQRRDAERILERTDREHREKEERAQSDRGALRAVTVEALFNCINLMGLSKVRLTPRDSTEIVSREAV